MATLAITQVTGGLKIVSENSTAIYNQYSTKINNNNTDELIIVSHIKGNYAEFIIDFSDYTSVTLDGVSMADAGTLQDALELLNQNLGIKPYNLQVQNGLIAGVSIVQKFGERESFGTTATGEDVWRGNELTPAADVRIPLIDSDGVLISIVSESDADNGATATGILTAVVHYIDVTGDEQEWAVTLDGTTPVDSGILMRHINDVHALTVGGLGVAVGHVKVYLTGDTGTVYSMIALGGNQSLVTNYMIPLGKTLYLQEWDCTEANAKRLTMRIRSTSHDGILNTGVFIFKDVAYVKDSATGELRVLSVEPAGSVIKVSGWSVLANAETSAGYWGYLIDD